jgi:hypothetical protein
VEGTAKVGSIDVYGTVEGSIDVYGTVEGSIDVDGTVEGSIDVDGTVEGSIDVYGTAKVGSIDVYGTVEGRIYVYGTRGNLKDRTFYGKKIDAIQADHALLLALATPDEVAALRAALVAGKIDGHLYEGECACLVGTIEKSRTEKTIVRDSHRLAEKWYMAISKGHTPETSTHAQLAVEWIDAFVESKGILP